MYKADHTCLRVSDLEVVQRFYETALGFVKTEERKVSDTVTMVFMTDPDGSYQVQFLCGKGKAQPGFGHTAVVAENFEDSFEKHTKMGCVKGTVITQNNLKSYFITDPEGYEIEILNR